MMHRRAHALALALLLFALIACGNADEDPGAKPSKSGSASLTPSATATAVDTEHAEDPPGPLKGPLVAGDVLVYDQKPLSPYMVKSISKIKGVKSVEQLSMANVSIEDHLLSIASVDPATYRRFTPSGKQEDIWARVAGGELALSDELGKQIQQPGAFVQLGNDKTAPKVHIGAYADQAAGVNMVVNEKWGQDLRMIQGNALLIATGIASPQSVRKPIERIAGTASVQMLDAVARFGLDRSVSQTAIPTGGSVASAVGAFSYRVSGRQVLPDPAWVAANIVTQEVPILGRLTCNRVMFPQLRAALQEVVEMHLSDKVYQTAGCYNPRFIARTTSLSNHAFGIAIDINSLENGRGTVGQMDPEVVRIFKKWGFAWGGDWNYTDPMHFEMNQLVQVS